MNTKRTHIVIPQQLVAEIDTLVGKRRRSTFLTQAAEKELMRLRQLKALEAAAGSWKDKEHPELKRGAAKWVDTLAHDSLYDYDPLWRRCVELGVTPTLVHSCSPVQDAALLRPSYATPIAGGGR